MKRSEASNEYKWDFTYIYKSENEFKKDLKLLEEKVILMSHFKNQLNKKEIFYQYLELDEQTDEIESRIEQYLHLVDVDQTDMKIKNLEGLYDNLSQKLEELTSFIAPEIKKIGEKQILQWLSESKIWNKEIYGYKKFFEEANHILDEKSEDLLAKISRSRGFAFEMYDSMAYADFKEVKIKWKDKIVELTSSLYSDIMENSDPILDQDKRVEANNLFFKHYEDRKHSFAKIYEGIIQVEIESIKLRNYKNCLQASLNGDDVSENIYEELLKYGQKNIEPFVKYFSLIKSNFNLEKFYWTDTQLKLVKNFKKTYSVEDAKKIIREAFSLLGEEYLEKLEIAWSANKIDFYEDTNKTSGAYSSSGYKQEPIILMNWDNNLNSVLTLAHEIGHSVHTLFSDEYQQYPLSDYPIILAEVASTLNEHIIYDYLIKTSESNDEKIYLLQKRISDIISTFYRQIQFAKFEHEAHKIVENDESLNAENLAELYSDVANMYGFKIFDQTKDKKNYTWTYVSHFFQSPFYVYKYAIDIAASYDFFEKLKSGDNESVLKFLKSGGHKEPLKILKDFNIDFNNINTYNNLKDNLNSLIKQLEDLLKISNHQS